LRRRVTGLGLKDESEGVATLPAARPAADAEGRD
jgi:hypothetical protein